MWTHTKKTSVESNFHLVEFALCLSGTSAAAEKLIAQLKILHSTRNQLKMSKFHIYNFKEDYKQFHGKIETKKKNPIRKKTTFFRKIQVMLY